MWNWEICPPLSKFLFMYLIDTFFYVKIANAN
jgi:hypothetical protein